MVDLVRYAVPIDHAALAGTATAIGWVRQSDAHLLVRRLDADGSLGPTWDVSNTSLSIINGQAAVAANASGRVAVAWRRGNDSHVFFRGFDVASGPSSGPSDLTADPDIALFGTNVQVAIDSSGVGVVVWHRNTDCHIIGRRVAADGTPGAQQDISGQADNAVGDTNPGVAADSSGDAIFAWHRDGESHDKHAVARRWRTDLSLADIQSLSSDADIPSMASFGTAAPTTTAAVAWQRESDKHILAATAGPSSVGGTVDVSTGPSATATAPAAAPTSDGGLAVAWKDADGHVAIAFEAGAGLPPGPTSPTAATDGPTPGSPPPGGAPQPGPQGPGGSPALTLPGSATFTKGRVKLAVACAFTAACTGSLDLFAQPSTAARRRAPKRVRLAHASLSLNAGERRTITLNLSKRALRRFRGAKRIRATAVIRLGTGAQTSAPLTLTQR